MRLPTTKLELPNNFEKLKFPVNRIGDNVTFNNRVQLLEENFQQLLEYGSVVDNRSPLEDVNLNVVSGHTYKHIETVKKTSGKVILIAAKEIEIDFIFADVDGNYNGSLTKTYDQIKDAGNLKFKNISYIKYNENRLYVYDSVYDTVFVYDINTFINDDTATTNIKFLKQFFKIKDLVAFDFSGDGIIGIKSDKLICYNRDFNVKDSITLENIPIDVQVNGTDIYILYNNKVEVYDISLVKKREFSYLKTFGGESLRILFSKYDSGVLYLLTSDTIYKYKSDGTFIGYFKDIVGKNMLDVSIYDNETDDLVFTLDTDNIQLYKDKINEFKLYDENNLKDTESVGDLQINNLELEQDFVYNAVIQKMIFNTFLLYNSLLFRAFIQTDVNGILEFRYLENLQNSELLDKNLVFYGQNEVFSYQTFNRAFKEIYDIQLKILDLLQFNVVENSTNTLII